MLHAQLARPGGIVDWAAASCGGLGSSLWLLANIAVPAGAALQVCCSLLAHALSESGCIHLCWPWQLVRVLADHHESC